MASIQRLEKSEYEGEDPQMDEVKKKKRKKKKLEYLTDEINRLQSENKKLVESIKAKEEAHARIETSNNIFKAQFVELTDRLHFLKMIEAAQEVKK
ncbi:ocs element-binding factor [Spatholobus suberectus]|nr:ocs element-binding factor [Spatholobus suberectus]